MQYCPYANLTIYYAFRISSASQFTIYKRWRDVLHSCANFELTNGKSVWDGPLNGRVGWCLRLSTGLSIFQRHVDQFPQVDCLLNE